MNSEITPKITIENTRCKITELPVQIANKLTNELSVKVPNYWFSQKYKMGYWDGTQKFFQRPANVFPTGLLPRVIKILKEDYEITPVLIDKRVETNKYALQKISQDYKISETKIARDYQVDTINKLITNEVSGLSFTRGIVNIATNGGKTAIAIGFIKELYSKLQSNNSIFLFVTHSKEIARQAKLSIENDLNIPVGFIGDGKWQPERVTVAIVTTLYRRMKSPEFKELVKTTIGFVADECHHSSSTSWYEVFNAFTNASIRIGLTGTVDKTNPVNEMKLYACTGDIINKISNEYLIENGYSARPICIMFTVSTPELEKENYSDAYNLGIVESEERLDYITRICEKETSSHNTVLILVEHIEHGELIKSELKKLNKQVFFTNGELSSDTRQQLLDALKDGKIDVLISTAILDEGVDVSNINAIIYARGMKSTRKLLQGIGRGLRKKTDGSKLRFYDFIDDMNSTLLLHSQNRFQVLKQEKFKVKLMTIVQYEKSSWEDIEHE